MGMQLAYMVGILAAIYAASAAAEDDLGPISELPETGSWAEYKMELERTQDGKVSRRDATLTIASVGEGTVSGKKAQWIAVTVRIDAAEQLRSIILLPVRIRDFPRRLISSLAERANRVRERTSLSSERVQQQARRGPLETLLPGKLTHVEALDEKRVKTAVGEIVAKGRTGRAKLVDRRGADELL